MRSQLEQHGHVFKTQSDTETIVHAYEQWGVEALSKLNGMFGLAIWDEDDRRLILARDPFGVKPLYYWDDGQRLVFASEIRAILLHPKVKREVDLEALDQYLTLTFVPSPRTAFLGIHKLQPGQALICSPQRVNLVRFYRFPPQVLRAGTESELVEELREKILQAVKRQMIADVKIGALLSGGVDSSVVAHIMADLTGGPIETFTVGFPEGFDQNELEYARDMARRIGSNHHEVVVSADDYSEFLPESIRHLEEPVATASTLAFYQVCRLACQHVKVVLTGQGADKSFAGYPRHLGECYGHFYRALPKVLRNWMIGPLIERLPRNEQAKRAVQSLGLSNATERMSAVYTIFDDSLKHRLYRDGLRPGRGVSEAVEFWASEVSHLDSLSQMLYVDSRLSLPDNLLVYGDKMAVSMSLEARVPFLDLDLMVLVESISSRWKIKGWTQKYILKQAVSKWLPRDVIRRKKIGFATPVDGWFRGELQHWIEDRLLASDAAIRHYFRIDTVRGMIKDHQRGRQDYKRTLYALLIFEIWHQQFIDQFDPRRDDFETTNHQ